jgi:hypothetical protein
MSVLAGLIAVLVGTLGAFHATNALHRSPLPAADNGLAALLGVALVFGGLELMLGSPAGLVVVPLLLARRLLALYNKRLLRSRVRGADLWPAAGDLALAALAIAGVA